MAILARLKELGAGVADFSVSNETAKSDAAHIEADSLLLEYLEIIGAADLVAAYKAIKSPEHIS